MRFYLLILLSACATSSGPDGSHDPSPPDEASWQCADVDGATECRIAESGGDHAAYTCSAGETGCPPGGEDWACIAEEDEVACREVVTTETMTAMRPATCNTADWKVFFCQLAQGELDEQGYAFTLDCGELQDMLQLEPLPTPSCDQVVDPLELKSWTEATYAGCSGDLSQEITAWCYNTNLILSRAGACAP